MPVENRTRDMTAGMGFRKNICEKLGLRLALCFRDYPGLLKFLPLVFVNAARLNLINIR